MEFWARFMASIKCCSRSGTRLPACCSLSGWHRFNLSSWCATITSSIRSQSLSAATLLWWVEHMGSSEVHHLTSFSNFLRSSARNLRLVKLSQCKSRSKVEPSSCSTRIRRKAKRRRRKSTATVLSLKPISTNATSRRPTIFKPS